ncbi:MAG: hypothetical protein ACI9MB_002115, partial [Verrucomicrobiales bacterium]
TQPTGLRPPATHRSNWWESENRKSRQKSQSEPEGLSKPFTFQLLPSYSVPANTLFRFHP